MTIYIIYRAINSINGKSYIGYTSNLKRRISDHRKSALSSRYPNNLFHKAIRKYGFDLFIWETLFESEDKNFTLKVMEPFFIATNRHHNNCYNLAKGGDGNTAARTETQKRQHSKRMKGRKFSEQHKKKLSQSLKNRVFTEEHRKKLSKSMTGNKNCVGRKLSAETKAKISISKNQSKISKR